MARRGFIPDGYQYEGYIGAVPGLFDEMRFTYRPMTTLERQQLLAENSKISNAARAHENTCKTVAAKIVDWDLENPKDGEKVSVSWKVLYSQMEPSLYERILGIVMGVEASSPDPKKQAKEPTLEQEKEAIESEQLLGDKLLEDAQKN